MKKNFCYLKFWEVVNVHHFWVMILLMEDYFLLQFVIFLEALKNHWYGKKLFFYQKVSIPLYSTPAYDIDLGFHFLPRDLFYCSQTLGRCFSPLSCWVEFLSPSWWRDSLFRIPGMCGIFITVRLYLVWEPTPALKNQLSSFRFYLSVFCFSENM